MTDRHRHHHHGWGPRPGRRPPWWPEAEPFPPTDPDARHRMRRGFMRRAGWGFAFFFGIVFAASSLALSVVSGAFGVERDKRLVLPTALLGLALLALVAFVVLRTWRRTVRPMADVMDAAERLSAGDYSSRVRERGPGEMRRLARSFNQMAERLEAGESQRRGLFADLAHELRTPLSVIRGNAEGMLEGVYPSDREHLQPIVEEADLMARLLEDLRTLSTAEAGALQLHRETVEVGRVVEDAVQVFRGAAEAGGVRLETRVARDLPPLEADQFRLAQVMSNVLSNAVRHAPRGGRVRVEAGTAEGVVTIDVDDDGPGIPVEQLPHVFDRFAKSDGSGGMGLGLAIAKAVVEAHDGTIEARSEAGGGTTIRIRLPVELLET
ncbi:MAG: HAMP domain-containing sensor histidine kinase [Actinomycetota bacterium]